jgi:hypothetical protein
MFNQTFMRAWGIQALGLASTLLLAAPQNASATNRTWTGLGTDNHWATAANWGGDVAPAAGDDLFFPTFSTGGAFSNFNNYPAGAVFGKITISEAMEQRWSIGGNPIVLTNGLTVSAARFSLGATIYCDVSLPTIATGVYPGAISVSGFLTLAGTFDLAGNSLNISDKGTIICSGLVTNSSGDLASYVTQTNAGSITIPAGGLWTADSLGTTGSILLDGLATNQNQFAPSGVADPDLGVSGSGNALSGTGSGNLLEAHNSAGLAPGDNGVGTLHCAATDLSGIQNDGYLDYPGGILQIVVNGPNAGTDYSQLVTGTCTLTTYSEAQGFAATLDAEFHYIPQLGDSFEIVQKPAGSPLYIHGYFYDLLPSSIYDSTNGCSFVIDYDTNAITLTTVRVPSSSFTLWKGDGDPDGVEYAGRNWSFSNNWAGGAVPASGSRLWFTSNQFNLGFQRPPPLTNDIPVGLTVASLLFTENDYTLAGNALTVSEGITNNITEGTNYCHLGLVGVGSLVFDGMAGGTFFIDSSFNGSGTLRKVGAGTLIYDGTTMNSFVGAVAVENGALQVDGSFLDGSFSVSGGLLHGAGTVSGVTISGGTLKPGDGIGVLHIQGDLNMNASAVFQVALNGPIAGSSYDQLQVNGGINLTGATLNLVPGYAATPGTSYLILVNDGTDPIKGTFAALPEGTVFAAGGHFFSISYKAGSGGNDIVVTAVNPPIGFSGIVPAGTGSYQLQGTGAASANYTVQANTNLVTTNWVDIGPAATDPSGHFSFDLTNSLSFPQQFFRLKSP